MPRPAREDEEPLEPPTMPAPYPLDMAMEQAYTPEPVELIERLPEAQSATQTDAGLVIDASSGVEDVRARPREGVEVIVPLRDQPPETAAQRLSSLQPWKAKVVLALMECGGVLGLAATKARVSMRSVQEHLGADPDFAMACKEAIGHSTDLVEAAVIRGATIGDLQPVYQSGALVGYKRVRNTKDAELALTIRGRMPDQQVNVTHGGRVEVVSDDQVAGVLASVAKLLFRAPVKTLKVVSESDKNGG